jgi:multiple sugar transport system substrate-binding protein
LQELVDRFNREHEGEIRVEYREMSRVTDEYFDELTSDFQAGATPPIDVIGGDVIWASEFADNGWIEDITRRMYADYSPRVPDAFLQAPITSCSFDNKFWGVPWFTDAGLLYYRQDLLEESGFSEPPKTWDELKEMADKVTQDAGVKDGFVFQGAEYEGGVVNGLEFIWNAGGNVLTGNITVNDPDKPIIVSPNVIQIGSEKSARGLQIERSMIEDGVSPQEVVDFREEDSLDAFNAGDAVFLRGWPYMYQIFGQEGQVDQGQVGIAQLPGGRGGDAELQLPRRLEHVHQRRVAQPRRGVDLREVRHRPRAAEVQGAGGLVPADPDEPLRGPGDRRRGSRDRTRRNIIERNARSRPITPYYSDISSRLAGTFNASLRGEVSPEEAVDKLQAELENIAG